MTIPPEQYEDVNRGPVSNNCKSPEIETEAKVMPAPSFDFEFICHTLNLIQIQGGTAGINPTMVTDIEQDENNDWVFTLESDQQYTLNDGEMRELERNMRRRIEDNKAKAKEAMKDSARMQAEVLAELQSGVQPGKIVGVSTQARRFRQQ